MLWPKDDKPAPFSKIVGPLRSAIEFAYDLKRKNCNKSIPWGGLDVGNREKVTCLSPRKKLKKASLDFQLEDQGRDALDAILEIAVQLGIEQGRRMTVERLQNGVILNETIIVQGADLKQAISSILKNL